MSQKKIGICLSYLNLMMGMIVNIFLTPYLIASLGDVDYSLYKVMHSFAGPLTMFHLGISTIVTRSIVKFENSEDYTLKDKQNTIALALFSSIFMSLFVLMAGAIMYHLIPNMYGKTYSTASIDIGQNLFVMYVIASVMHMLTDAFSGCLIGREHFVASSAIPLGKTITKIILIVILLNCGMGVTAVVAVDLVLAISILVFTVCYAVFVLHEIPKFYYFDRKQVLEIITFGLAILLQAFVNQVNNNVDTIILGAYIEEKYIITMYSSALAIYAIYNSLISVISNYYLPQATKLVSRNAIGKEMTDFVIAPGRFQAIIAVACIFGFALFGKNFISIWIGAKYLDAYWVTLALMIPVTIPLVENAVIAILDATLKRIYRSIVLVFMAVLNIVISVWLVNKIGFWGTALGTVISIIVGHGFLMNIYYSKEFGIEIGRMFVSIFKGILPAGCLTLLVCLPISIFLPDTVIMFLFKCTCFVIIYALCLYKFGLDKSEKMFVIKLINKKI